MEPKNILVLFGGCSTEHDVSLQSAHAVLSALDRTRYQPLTVGVTRSGQWLYYTGPLDAIPTGQWQADRAHCVPCAVCPDRGVRQLLLLDGSNERLDLDAAFPILHGKNGEDGTVQGLLELAGIPIIGCGALASALCMDKDRAHKLAALAGVRVPKSAVFPRGASMSAIGQAAEALGYPLFVKPVRAGSSFGVTKVTHAADLPAAVDEAFRHDTEVLLEEAVPGFEVGCAVLGNHELTVGAVDEIELSQGFFDFEEKYTLKTSRIHCPARISRETELALRQAAKAIYRALGCHVMARVDLFLTPEGDIVFNEVNTIPGFTRHSRYPTMMKEIGLNFPALVSRLIELGVEQ